MKIVWWNPNKIASRGVSLVKTGWLEMEDQVQFFYRSASGPGIFGTVLELLVNRKARCIGSRECLTSIHHSYSFFRRTQP